MSYNVTVNGEIILRKMTDEERKKLTNDLEMCFCEKRSILPTGDEFGLYVLSDGTTDIDVHYNGNYYDSEIFAWLKIVAPYTVEGNLEYTSEDETLWRHNFRDGAWYEDNGAIIYKINKTPFIPMRKAGE